MTEPTERPVCPHCGSSNNISVDASAIWGQEAQDWVLACVYDAFHCGDCDSEFKSANWIKETEHAEHQP